MIYGNVCYDTNYGLGINLDKTVNITVSSNTCSNNTRGIGVWGAKRCTISNNNLHDNSNKLIDSEYLTINGNRCTSNTMHGIFITKKQHHMIIEGNIIKDNQQFGIAVIKSYGHVIKGNTCNDNGISNEK